MVETSKDLVSKVSGEARIEMLGRNWLSHDAQWQMAVVQSFGWDAGNQLNQIVTRDMRKTMMLRYLNSAGISGVENIKQLRDLMIITQ